MSEKVAEARKRLSDGYNKIINELKSNKPSEGNLTNPLLLNIPDNCFDGKTKVMIFGQETNDWHGKFSDDFDVDNLMRKYTHFFIDRKSPYSNSGTFMQFINSLRDSEQMKDVVFVWNNVIKIGKAKGSGKPDKTVLEFQKPLNEFIKEEIKILEPDIFIFLTGPNYGSYIKLIFGDSIDKKSYRDITKFSCAGKPAIGCYHPGYIRRIGKLDEYCNKIVEFIKNPK